MDAITIQPGQPGEGMNYNPSKSLPYPYHINPKNGDVDRQDFWRGDPSRLIGFQRTASFQSVSLWLEDFVADPQQAVGMFPVFAKTGGGMYNLSVPITSVS